MNNLGEVLKERRKAKKLTLKQLAIISGVSLSHLARIEGETRFPSAKVLMKLSKPLGFSEIELLRLAGYVSQDNTDRLAKLKEEIKMEIAVTLGNLLVRIESL